MLASIVLAVAGVVWGLVSSSQIVLFDGMWGILGIGLTWLSLHAARAVAGGPTPRYPFGREALAPLVIAIQGVALLATCTYASIDAVLVILDGGSDVSADAAFAYGVLTLAAAVVVWWWLRQRGRGSELLAAEATQWLAGAALSLGMVVAFGAVLLLRDTDYSGAGRYADPGLVLAVCVLLVPTPLRMIRSTVVELLEGAPPDAVQVSVRGAVSAVRAEFGLDEPYLRATKVGRKLYVEVDFVVPGEDWHVSDEDRIRRALEARLRHLPFDLWLNVELTGDPGWAV